MYIFDASSKYATVHVIQCHFGRVEKNALKTDWTYPKYSRLFSRRRKYVRQILSGNSA